MSLNCIAGLQAKVEVHPTFNHCNGVVTHEDFDSESEEDLKSFYEPEGVVHVHRNRQKVDGSFHRLLLF